MEENLTQDQIHVRLKKTAIFSLLKPRNTIKCSDAPLVYPSVIKLKKKRWPLRLSNRDGGDCTSTTPMRAYI